MGVLDIKLFVASLLFVSFGSLTAKYSIHQGRSLSSIEIRIISLDSGQQNRWALHA